MDKLMAKADCALPVYLIGLKNFSLKNLALYAWFAH